MDLAYYLNEILGLQGEVNVPGLGYFVRVRVNGYYNDEEGKFYPPYNDIQFDRQSIDDDTLAKYIADKKNISLASSKYFTEKYVSNILREAAVKETELGTLGWLTAVGSRLVFRPRTASGTDPQFYGLPPLQVYKLGQQPVPNRHIPDLSLTIAPEIVQPEVTEPAKQEVVVQEEVYVEEKRGIGVWAIMAIVIGVLGLIAAGIYLYRPELFVSPQTARKPLPPIITPAVYDTPDTTKKDTTVKAVLPTKDTAKTTAPIKKDTALKAKPADEHNKIAVGKLSVVTAKPGAAQPTKSTKPVDPEDERPASTIIKDDTRNHYEITAGSFKTLTKANEAMAQFKRRGIDARLFTYGKWNKVTLGSFYIRADAVKAQKALELTDKIKNGETIIEEIKK